PISTKDFLDEEGGRVITVKRVLLNNCQEAFEGVEKPRDEVRKLKGITAINLRSHLKKVSDLEERGTVLPLPLCDQRWPLFLMPSSPG
ncbi:unnamed protein product, partial [Musa hybrid cultivar]